MDGDKTASCWAGDKPSRPGSVVAVSRCSDMEPAIRNCGVVARTYSGILVR